MQLFISPYIIYEIQSKLVNRFGFKETEIKQFISRIKISAQVVKPSKRINAVPNDRDDNAILECAVEAQAQLIVTADTDLLELNPYEGIGITHPKALKNIFAADYKRNLNP